MSDEELIARLRNARKKQDEFEAVMLSDVAADRIEALVKVRREDALELLAAHGQAQDAYEAQVKAEERAERLEAAIKQILSTAYADDHVGWQTALEDARAALKGADHE